MSSGRDLPPPPRIGDILMSRGLISPAQLAKATTAQEETGGPLGRHLILQGALTRRCLYAALAEQWEAPLVDLAQEPPDAHALLGVHWRDVNKRGWMPWRRNGDTVVVATSVSPTQEVAAAARAETGAQKVEFVTTTDWDIMHAVQVAFREELRIGASEQLAAEVPELSARYGLRWWQQQLPYVALVALIISTVLWPREAVSVLFAASNLVFAMSVLFKVAAAAWAPASARHRRHWDSDVNRLRRARNLPAGPPDLPDDELPVYTILVPAYHESNVVQKLLNNMAGLDYPASKLDILLLLEEDDVETVSAAQGVRPPEYVRIVVVPRGTPQTKPRACNYGMFFARGEYVVIFDAEDRPDPSELRDAVARFRQDDFERERHGGRPLACVQGALCYFNADYNVLTRMFAVEYAHWFDMMLPGMDAMKLPIPLGGTSNHFRADVLEEVGAWDPYNVTEDADLGLRLDAAGYRTGVMHATTWEEATSRVPAWIRQRTRWIKGYMMTAAVNLRHPVRWVRRNRLRGLVTMLGLVLGTPLAFLAYPLAFLLTALTYVGFGVSALGIPQWLVDFGWINMVGSNLAMIVISAIAATRRYSWRIGLFAVFNPVYWFLHSFAAWRAAWQILRDPFTWEKTPHGLSGDYVSDSAG